MTITIISIVLTLVAFVWFAKGMMTKGNGGFFNMKIPIILIGSSLIFPFLTGILSGDGLIDSLFNVFRNNGIGLIIGGILLKLLRGPSKLLFGFGSMALIIYIAYMVFQFGIWGAVNGFRYMFSSTKPTEVQNIASQNPSKTVSLLVELGEDDNLSEIKTILDKYNATSEQAFPNVTMNEDKDLAQVFIVYVDESQKDDLLKELAGDKENVDDIAVNEDVTLEKPINTNASANKKPISNTNDPEVSKQWFLSTLEADAVYKILQSATPNKKAIVAILDTGVDGNHEDMKSAFKKSRGNIDKHGHGSHCAGLAGAVTNNKTGIASLNWEGKFIEIAGYNALDGGGRGTIETVAQAIIDAAEDGVDVISLSLGGYHPKPPKAEKEAVEYALSKGCVVVVAAGNDNEDAKNHSPANIPGVICVAALDQNNEKAQFSNTNTSLTMPICAPGVDIFSLKPGSEYVPMSGTSMATPIVSGLCGILRSFKPELTPKEIYEILKSTGKNTPNSDKVGQLINPPAAIKFLQNGI